MARSVVPRNPCFAKRARAALRMAGRESPEVPARRPLVVIGSRARTLIGATTERREGKHCQRRQPRKKREINEADPQGGPERESIEQTSEQRWVIRCRAHAPHERSRLRGEYEHQQRANAGGSCQGPNRERSSCARGRDPRRCRQQGAPKPVDRVERDPRRR